MGIEIERKFLLADDGWRGLGPPNGESYGGDPNACNTCHQTCGAGFDFVCAPALHF